MMGALIAHPVGKEGGRNWLKFSLIKSQCLPPRTSIYIRDVFVLNFCAPDSAFHFIHHLLDSKFRARSFQGKRYPGLSEFLQKI